MLAVYRGVAYDTQRDLSRNAEYRGKDNIPWCRDHQHRKGTGGPEVNTLQLIRAKQIKEQKLRQAQALMAKLNAQACKCR